MIFDIIHLFSKEDTLQLKQKDAQMSLRLEKQKLKQIEVIVRQNVTIPIVVHFTSFPIRIYASYILNVTPPSKWRMGLAILTRK